MVRFLATFLIFAAIPASQAHAGLFSPDPQVKAERQDLREARRYSKDFDKLTRRFERATKRGNDKKLVKLDAELKPITRAELASLRSKGVLLAEQHPAHAKPPPGVHPRHWDGTYPEHKNMDALRDDLLAMRDIEVGRASNKDLRRKARLMGEIGENFEARWERQEKQLARAKARRG